MPKIIVIGSATRDIFIDAESLKKEKNFCFPFGEKTEIEKVRFFSGGGGVNVATTFALQDLKTNFCGVIGQDLIGAEIIKELKEKKINTDLLKIKKDKTTDLGMIFHANRERTIILCHNASKSLNQKDIDLKKLKNTDWIYIAPLWGKSGNLTEKLISFAKKNKIKTALNPSLDQLSLKKISRIINQVDVLILNSQEASFLTKIQPFQEKSVIHKIASLTKAIVIITKGKKGAICFDGKFLYYIPAQEMKVIDATGAGDSFGSGFVTGLIKGIDMEKSLTLAMSNAIANIGVIGANQGLLKKGQKLLKIKIRKTKWSV